MKTTVWYLLVICLIKVKEMVNYIFAENHVDDVFVAYDGDGDLVIPPLGLPRPRPSPPD